MKFEITEEQLHKAKIPHELFLINLVFNHILLFVIFVSMANSLREPLAIVPILSLAILTYTLWRARRSLGTDPWFVQCHWQVAARRSRLFIGMLGIMALVSFLGWLGYAYAGMMKVAVYALVGGMGMLPTMVTVLVLIILESDALHQARHGQLPAWVVRRFPNRDAQALPE